MGNKALIPILSIFFLFQNNTTTAQEGENLFKTYCAACHKTTAQRFIGPGLANIADKRAKDWFTKFVRSSQSLIKSGDAEAVKIFEEYNQSIMPDQVLTDVEIDMIYEYIKSVSPAKSDATVVETETEAAIPFEPTEEDISRGRDLFSGIQRFKNKGPSCISCHHVRNDNVIAGGALAADLTDVYERLGKEGVQGMITGLPYPQMKFSYEDHPVTEEEAVQLTAFLKDAGEQRFYQRYTSYRNKLLVWGIVGSFLLMGVFPLFWYKRKKESVNKRIYERQIESHN